MDWLKQQLVYATLLRICFVLYGLYHDSVFALKYTDVDYHVFSDAAKLVTDGESPYSRPTYRYSPLIAWILTLNVYLHPVCGKLLFVTCDLVTGYLIHRLHKIYGTENRWMRISTFVWLFNPLTLVVSTRGSADSLMICLILTTLYLIESRNDVASGLIFGLAMHMRIYPAIYSLPFYLTLENGTRKCSNLMNLLAVNRRRLKFTSAAAVSLTSLTFLGCFYYGRSFVDEAYFYHLFRKDVRHNFSPYFYMMYLTVGSKVPFLGLVSFLPQLVLLLVIGFKFYERKYLPLCLFAQTFVFVSFNKVCTSQYFLWYIGLIPFIIPKLRMSMGKMGVCVTVWMTTQCVWLFCAYLLEFQGVNTFFYLWLAGLAFFSANVYILAEIIENYCVKC